MPSFFFSLFHFSDVESDTALKRLSPLERSSWLSIRARMSTFSLLALLIDFQFNFSSSLNLSNTEVIAFEFVLFEFVCKPFLPLFLASENFDEIRRFPVPHQVGLFGLHVAVLRADLTSLAYIALGKKGEGEVFLCAIFLEENVIMNNFGG